MSISMYQAGIPVIVRYLTNLSTILDKAAAHCAARKIDPSVLINFRLSPDMLPFARQIRQACGMPTTAVGLITEAQQAEALLQAGDADLVALARAFLYQPRWGWQAAAALGGQVQAHPAYWRSLPREAQAVFGQVAIGGR